MIRIMTIGLISIFFGIFLSNCEEDPIFYSDASMFVEEAKSSVEGLTVQGVKTVLDTASYYLILDVREPNEYHPGYITDAVNLPRGILEFNIGNEKFWENKMAYQPLKEDLIFVYCKKGSRAILAAQTLQQMGFTNVKYIIGGFKKWELTFPNDYQFDEVEHHTAAVEEEGGC